VRAGAPAGAGDEGDADGDRHRRPRHGGGTRVRDHQHRGRDAHAQGHAADLGRGAVRSGATRRLAGPILAGALAAAAAQAVPAAKPMSIAEARRGHLMAPPDSVYEMAILRRLADPQWEGRGVGTAGLDSAANFLAGEMRRLGLKPGGEEGGYFQPFEVTTGVEVGESCAL